MNESLTKAEQGSEFVVGDLRAALKTANRVEAGVLLVLIGKAAEIAVTIRRFAEDTAADHS